MRSQLHQQYANPFPVTAIIKLEGQPIAAEVTRCLFETARDYGLLV
jgi:hypothetical protein